MLTNLKTLLFFLLIALLSAIPFLNEKIGKGKEVILSESENARELYTGKTREVYDPLDNAYVVTDKLREMIKKEESLNFGQNKKLPIVSVWIDPRDLHDEERGILKNPLKKGRLWERASYISYYENGERKFSSFAGMRLHGDSSRLEKIKNFRFNFRKKNGEKAFYEGLPLSIDQASKTKSIVLRREGANFFANDLSFSIIKNNGGIAPDLKYASVYLNGEFYYNLFIIEHQKKEQLADYLGHKNFVYYKGKAKHEGYDYIIYKSAHEKLMRLSSDKVVSHINENYDLETIFPWYLTVAYFAMFDWGQGSWFRELNYSDQKWKLIAWDFDTALDNWADRSKNAWEINGVWMLHRWKTPLAGILFRNIYKNPHLLDKMKGKLPDFCQKLNATFEEKIEEYKTYRSDFFDKEKFDKSLTQIERFYRNRNCLAILDPQIDKN